MATPCFCLVPSGRKKKNHLPAAESSDSSAGFIGKVAASGVGQATHLVYLCFLVALSDRHAFTKKEIRKGTLRK